MGDNNHTRILVPELEVNEAVYDLAHKIWQRYQPKDSSQRTSVEVVQVLEGAAMLTSDLVRALDDVSDGELEVGGPHSIKVASYDGMRSLGKITLERDVPDEVVRGKHVLLTEDILDTGLTLRYLIDRISGKEPKSLGVCVFFEKRGVQRKAKVDDIEYIGMRIPNRFVVGCGLDLNGKYRNKRNLLEVLHPEMM